MTDSFEAATFSLGQADYQVDSELSSTPVANNLVNLNISHDQTNHPTDLEPPSIETASAVAMISGTTELLLLLVVSEISVYDRTSIRRVSKTWKAAIEKVGHALEPSDYGFWIYEPSLRAHWVPVYLMKSPCRVLRLNLCSGLSCGFGGYYTTYHGIRNVVLHLMELDKLASHANEFITDPPVTQVMVHANPRWRVQSEDA